MKQRLYAPNSRKDLEVPKQRGIVGNTGVEDSNRHVRAGKRRRLSCDLPCPEGQDRYGKKVNGRSPSGHSSRLPVLQTRFMLSVSTQLKSEAGASNLV